MPLVSAQPNESVHDLLCLHVISWCGDSNAAEPWVLYAVSFFDLSSLLGLSHIFRVWRGIISQGVGRLALTVAS